MARQKSPKANKNLRTAAKLSGLALQMGLLIYLGNFLGKWLHREYALPYAEELMTLLAIGAAMYSAIRQAQKLNP